MPAPSTSSLEDEFVLASRLETHESPGVLLALISEMRHPSRSSFARCLPRDHFLSLGHRSPAGEDRKKTFPFHSAPQYPGDVINMAEATRLCIKASLLLPMQLITHHKHLKHGKHSGTQIQTDTQTQARTQNEPRLLGQQSNTVHPDSWFSRASTLAGAGSERKREGEMETGRGREVEFHLRRDIWQGRSGIGRRPDTRSIKSRNKIRSLQFLASSS